MSYLRMAPLCAGGREAAAGGTQAGQAQEAGTIRCTRDDRGPHDCQELLGQVVVHQPRALQRLREPLAAWPDLRPQRFRRRPANREGRGRGDGRAVPNSTKSRSPSHRSRRHAGKPSVGIVQEPSTRWLSSCRAAWPRALWTGSVGRATACFRRPRKSSCPAAVRTGPTCASTLQRRCMASAPGSTNSLSFSSCCAAWTKMNCSPVPDRILR